MKQTSAGDSIRQLQDIFYARSVAVVGASPSPFKMGYQWLKGLQEAGFGGSLYAVNRTGGEVLGLPIYPDLKSVPGPVDLVVSCIPRDAVLDLLDDCGEKGIKGIEFFTAGFKETGDAYWTGVEAEMVRRARKGKFRIIGPNCIGLSCPENGIPFGPTPRLAAPGGIGYVSQSGGHVGKMMEIGSTRRLAFSKVVSMGNGCDLGSADFLEYMAQDRATTAIGMYLEGPTDSRRLLDGLQAACESKPVVVWKGGRTVAGARATASHTGALAASPAVWSAALRQARAIEVAGLDEQADTLLLFQCWRPITRANAGIICGITDGGGGEAVLAADSCAAAGVNVPAPSAGMESQLLAILGQVGSVLSNPVDISQRSGDLNSLASIMDLMGAEPEMDMIVVYENVDITTRFLGSEVTARLNTAIIEFAARGVKPVLVVLPPGGLEEERIAAEALFSEKGVPVYPSMDRAARAIRHVAEYYKRGGK